MIKNNKLAGILALVIAVGSLGVFTIPVPARAATTINNCTDLQNMANNLAGDYVLGGNIDCSGVPDWSPLGTFTGKLDGAGYAIQHLSILGLLTNGNSFISLLDGAKVYNVSFTDVNFETNFEGGVLARRAINNTKIVNVHVQGNVHSNAALSVTGALVGALNNSDVYYSSANVTMLGYSIFGGLVGVSENESTIQYSYSLGSLSHGLIVSPSSEVGGLVGRNDSGSTISNSFSQASIDSIDDTVGGLVGLNENSSFISNSYATGAIDANTATNVGGLVGSQVTDATTDGSYWDTESSAQAISAGGSGKTTMQMQTQETFAGWDFDQIWIIASNQYPVLQNYDDDPAVLTEVAQVPSRVRVNEAVYLFDADAVGEQEYAMTPCGSGVSPLVGMTGGGHIGVELHGVRAGHTYTCEIFARNLTDVESNHLTIGPFTVIDSSVVIGSMPKLPEPTSPPTSSSPFSIPYQAPTGLGQQIGNAVLGSPALLTRNLYLGSFGSDVQWLQQYLNAHGFTLANSGPGSPGQETQNFGRLTLDAVIRFQKANGIVPAVGYVGPVTREFIK